MRQERFTEQAQEAIDASQKLVREFKHSQWDLEHILLALLQQEKGLVGDIIKEFGVDIESLKKQATTALKKTPQVTYETQQIYATPRVAKLIETSASEADRLKDEFIGTEHLLIAISGEEKGEAAKILKGAGIDQEKVYRALQKMRGGHRVTERASGCGRPFRGESASDQSGSNAGASQEHGMRPPDACDRR